MPGSKSSDLPRQRNIISELLLSGMHIDILAKNMTLDAPLRVFVEEKIGPLVKMVPDAKTVYVEVGKPSLHHLKGPVYYAEVNLKVGGRTFRAQVEHYDVRAAIVQVKEELHIQLKKFKEKRADLARKPR